MNLEDDAGTQMIKKKREKKTQLYERRQTTQRPVVAGIKISVRTIYGLYNKGGGKS